jgi:transposase InsO family protein
MCAIFDYSKQAYYAQLKENSKAQIEEDVIVKLVKAERTQCAKISGRSLHKCLKKDLAKYSISIGRDKFFEILGNNSLLMKPSRNGTRTTDSYHHFHKFANHVKYDYLCTRANEIWVSDITYVWLEQQRYFCYLSIITDMYSRKIVGYCVHEDLSVKGCLEALEMALKQRNNNNQKLIHHSDRGIQYCCNAYVKLLQKKDVIISMTQSGDPKENAIAERINRTIKCDFSENGQIHYPDVTSAKMDIKRIVNYYNNRKPHSSVEMLTPNEAHLQTGKLKRMWKTYYKKQKIS